ncbi:MAG: hypothetical protein IJW92_08150 [Clostridia bacterium]|nr:hypothetical protein [Clostridia bacterium]
MLSFFKFGNGDGEKAGKNKLWLILIAAVAGIALLIYGGNVGEQAEVTIETAYTPLSDELIIYQNYLEERIKTLCESVNGVNQVTVVVTLSGSFESVYATEFLDGNEEYVIIGSGSSSTALYLSKLAPTISGIGIVCNGGGNERIQHELLSLISATFHISTNRIYIAEAGG